MPCADDSKYIDQWEKNEAIKALQNCTGKLELASNSLSEQKARADKLARMLCEFITHLDEKLGIYPEHHMTEELLKWWDEHQKFDEKRMKKEEFQNQIHQLQNKIYAISQQIQDLDK
jgi:hypothetical protein